MAQKGLLLSDSVAEDIRKMLEEEGRFQPGDRLPNEIELSKMLGVSRATLREAVRTLIGSNILEIKRGKGTFVTAKATAVSNRVLDGLAHRSDLRDLFEIRLIFEPENAYLAAKRASDDEIAEILKYGEAVEKKLLVGEDRTLEEQRFHEAIATATHNNFVHRLLPVVFEAIQNGVQLLQQNQKLSQMNLSDDRMIMDFLKTRNADGARTAMRLHILHAMQELGYEVE